MVQVYSRQNHVRWYHILLVTIEVVFLISLIGACIYFSIAALWTEDNRVVAQSLRVLLQAGLVLPLIGGKVAYSIRYLFFPKLVLEYDEAGIHQLHGTWLRRPVPWGQLIPFGHIANIEISYNDAILFRFNPQLFISPEALSDQIKINGNAEQLDQFVKFAAQHGVSTQNTNFTQDDESHQLGVATLIFIALLGLYLGAMVLVHLSTQSHHS